MTNELSEYVWHNNVVLHQLSITDRCDSVRDGVRDGRRLGVDRRQGLLLDVCEMRDE